MNTTKRSEGKNLQGRDEGKSGKKRKESEQKVNVICGIIGVGDNIVVCGVEDNSCMWGWGWICRVWDVKCGY